MMNDDETMMIEIRFLFVLTLMGTKVTFFFCVS